MKESIGRAEIHRGDCREVLASLPEASVDAVVCDPPYELGFMGEAWDRSGVAFDPETWRAVLRVLKPGGHLLAFGGTRTYHRMACAIEDAGFEIRDQLQWLYGSGFPKSLDVSKALDKAAGAEREVIGHNPKWNAGPRAMMPGGGGRAAVPAYTAPATDDARQWEGWGTALKPANEPICLARKPLVGTVAENVLEHGTGALNIDGCRIGSDRVRTRGRSDARHKASNSLGAAWSGVVDEAPREGRWPANVLLDEEAAALLDRQTGTLTSGTMRAGTQRKASRGRGGYGGNFPDEATAADTYGDSGGASRFFYTAKASRSERTAGGQVENTHATVKPLDLMAYLVRLVTPPGGVVLDPFVGSGTTAVAALDGGWRFVGVEMDPHHFEIARTRIAASTAQGNLFLDGAA